MYEKNDEWYRENCMSKDRGYCMRTMMSDIERTVWVKIMSKDREYCMRTMMSDIERTVWVKIEDIVWEQWWVI